MAINFVNPNFNLIYKSKASELASNSVSSASPSGSASFSDVLGDAMASLQSATQTAAVTSQTNAATTVSAQTTSASTTGQVDLDAIFQKASDTYGVPVQLLKAVAKAESNFNPDSQSSAGAQGIMQLMPGTAQALGVTDAFDPEQNIMGGAKYLSQQLARYDGDTVLALAAYNAGPGNVAKYNGVPPFKETQNYITKVMAYAGEPITAGQLNSASAVTSSDESQIFSLSSDNLLSSLETSMLNADPESINSKDYELLLSLYRYRMQMDVLTEDDNEDNSSNLMGNISNLV